ncbi:MAG: HAD family phosphatase [Chlamydiales bacterium]
MKIGFLFDNDGVLIDSRELHWESWMRLMEEDPTFKITRKEFIESFGKCNDLILQTSFPHVSKIQHIEWAKQKEKFFRTFAFNNLSLLPGMEAFLQKVITAAIPHTIASSAPRENLEMCLNSTPLGRYFDSYLSGEEVEHGKPAPDIFIAAAKQLGYSPCDCVVFEDAPAGITAGRTAGAFVVALETTHKREALFGYDLIYSSTEKLDLEEILDAFIKKQK